MKGREERRRQRRRREKRRRGAAPNQKPATESYGRIIGYMGSSQALAKGAARRNATRIHIRAEQSRAKHIISQRSAAHQSRTANGNANWNWFGIE